MTREDREAVLRFEFQGASVRVSSADGEIGKLRRVSSVASTPSTEPLGRRGANPTP